MFWNKVKQIFLSPKYLIPLIGIGLLFFFGFNWSENHNHKHIGSFNDLLLIVWALFILEILLLKKIQQLRFHSFKQGVQQGNFLLPALLYCLFIGGRNSNVIPNISLVASIYTRLPILILIRQWAFLPVLAQANKDVQQRDAI